MIDRTLVECAGTVKACELALATGLAATVAGGTHHAFSDRGSGFTIMNDIAVASQYLVSHYDFVERVLVVDLDGGGGKKNSFMQESIKS